MKISDPNKITISEKKPKVFLGGTCNDSKWRNEFIEKLQIDFFNPVVDDWTEEDQKEELKQRQICDYVLYMITPEMKGVYSIAEVADDSNKQPEKTIFCFLEEYGGKTFDDDQIKSLKSVSDLVSKNGASVFKSIKETVDFLNKE